MDTSKLIYDWNVIDYEINRNPANHPHGVWFDDEIISAKHIPDLGDNLFILTKKGMMIRIVTGQTKDTKTKKSKGTRIMELRNKSRDGYVDEIIFTARLPAELLEDDQFETMDADGDGVISREEFEAAQQSNSLEEE